MKHMKHIKLFEEINIIDYKKYVIYKPKFETNSPYYNKFLYIFEIISIEEDNLIIVEKHYEYNSFENILTPENSTGIGNVNIFKNHILYTSDNIQDCIDMIQVTNLSDKYNL